MASPFRLFRKYQKTLLVAAGVILMFVFVIGDYLVGYIGRSAGGGPQGAQSPNAVAVRWNGGSLTNAELREMVFKRALANALVQRVEYAGRLPALEAGVQPQPLRVEFIYGPETAEQGVENNVVTTRIFADMARKAGMRISDEAIVQYLDELGRQNVNHDQMKSIIQGMNFDGQRVSTEYVLDALREEMLARNFLSGHQYAWLTVTPEERWQDWLKLNDRIVLEAVAFPVDKYLVDVPEPKPDQLLAFFNQYKGREPEPDRHESTELPSATPAFAIPRKIDAQFILAKYEDFLAKVEDEITDEEIAKYYEENKDPLFIKTDTRLIDDALEGAQEPANAGGSASAAEGATPAADAAAETADEPDANEAATTEGAEGESSPSGDDASTNSEGAQPTDDQQPATEDEPSSGSETDPPSDETNPPANETSSPPSQSSSDEEQSSSGRTMRPGPFRFAAFLQETGASEDASAADEASSTNVPTEAPPDDATADPSSSTNSDEGGDDSSDSSATDNEFAEETPATSSTQTPPAETTPAESPALESPAVEATPTDGVPITEPPAAEASPTSDKPKEFEPLESVRDEIRLQLAEERASKQLIELMTKVDNKLSGEFSKYFAKSFKLQDESGKMPPPPAELADLKPLAEEHGLTYGSTGLLSALEMRDTSIGRSLDADLQAQLWRVLFYNKDLHLYEPVETFDVDGNRYVSMKISDTPGRIPTLDEVRDEVVQAWKRQRAAELALKYVQEEAKKIQGSGQPLSASVDAAQTVIRTDPFPWLTGGDVSRLTGQQQPFRLSEPESIKAAGPQFMEHVFGLEEGKAGAVLNNDQSIAYLVRIANHELSPEALRAAYLAEANTWPGMRSMVSRRAQAAAQRLLRDVLAEAEVEWERPADPIEEDRE